MKRPACRRGRLRIAFASLAAILLVSPLPRAWAAPPLSVDIAMQGATSIPHFRTPRARLITAGQPAEDDWAAVAALGVRTVVNLRSPEEMAGRDEGSEVGAAGLTYVSLPVDGAGGVTRDKAALLWSLVEQAPGTLMVHCASGNRVGALLALGAAIRGGMDIEQAIVFGRSAGLDSLEPKVRELLATPAP